MDIFEKINSMPILTVMEACGYNFRQDPGRSYQFTVYKPTGQLDNSFKINTNKNIAIDFGGSGDKGGPFDIIGRNLLGVDTQTAEGRKKTIDFIKEKIPDLKDDDYKKENIKYTTDDEVLDKYIKGEISFGGYREVITRFLGKRGFSYDWCTKNHLLIGEIFKDFGYFEEYITSESKPFFDCLGKWQFLDGDKSKRSPIIIFPCYHTTDKGEKELVGCKFRRVDGLQIKGTKSHTPAGTKTGLLYDKINDKQDIYIVEGETDYIVMRLLGFTNVIGNLGGVQSNREELKKIVYKAPNIICLYDSDSAGEYGKKALQEHLGRQVLEVVFPIYKDKHGNIISDINDLYIAGYNTHNKMKQVLSDTKPLLEDATTLNKYPYIWIESVNKFYNTKYRKFQEKQGIADNLNITPRDLISLKKDGTIPSFEDTCYLKGGKKGCYNLLDETTIITHGGDADAVLHPHIKLLVSSICGGDKESIEWVHKSILYKLTHLNDVVIPAVIYFGVGGSGKSLFFTFLSKIFGEQNSLFGLNMNSINSGFDSYEGNKIIIEYSEVSSGNTFKDKCITDLLKTRIGQAKIEVNVKHQPQRTVDNIAWVHLSSNHSVPLQLDSKHSGNRRWTVLKSTTPIDPDIGSEIANNTINNRNILKSYVNRLHETYPDVKDMTAFKALDNEAKRNLEDACESGSNTFFEWFERRFPYIRKISVAQKTKLVERYCKDTGESPYDERFRQKNFDLGLSMRYEKKRLKIGGKIARGYLIHKTPFDKERIPTEEKGYWEDEELNKLTFK